MEARRKFDQEFKDGAVRIVRETEKPIALVARELGINEGTPNHATWRRWQLRNPARSSAWSYETRERARAGARSGPGCLDCSPA
jgi:transposase